MNILGVDGHAVKAAAVSQSCSVRAVLAELASRSEKERVEANPAPADRGLTLYASVVQQPGFSSGSRWSDARNPRSATTATHQQLGDSKSFTTHQFDSLLRPSVS